MERAGEQQEQLYTEKKEWNRRDAVSGWAGWAFLAHTEFGVTVNPIPTDRVIYAHQITVCPPSFETLKTSLDWKKIARTRTSSELVTVVVYSSEKKEERRKKKLFFQMLFAFCLGRLSTVRCGAARQSVNGGGGRGGGVGNGERRFVNPLSIGVLVVILPLFPRSDEFFTGFLAATSTG